MEKGKMNVIQFFILVLFFEFGTAIVVTIGMDAKQDAWISILLGMTMGILVYFMYIYLYHQFPNLPLTEYVKKIVGNKIGNIIAFLYILFFIYASARDLRDVGELLSATVLKETPMLIINGIIIFVLCYGLYLGMEVFARTSEIFFPYVLLLGLLFIIFTFLSGVVEINNLLPILESGWKTIYKTTVNVTFMFPFGEMIAFTMLLPFLNKPHLAGKIGILAIILSGLAISFTTAIDIAVLGVDEASRTNFPLLQVVSKISIGNIIQRLDMIAIIVLLLNTFFKIGIFFYAGVIGTVHLFKINNEKMIIYPIGIIITISSLLIAESYIEHIVEGQKIALTFIFFPFAVGIPFLLLIVHIMKKRLFNFLNNL